MNKTEASKKITSMVIKMKSDVDKDGIQYLSRDILIINEIERISNEFNLKVPKYCEKYDELVNKLAKNVLTDFIENKNKTIKKNMIVGIHNALYIHLLNYYNETKVINMTKEVFDRYNTSINSFEFKPIEVFKLSDDGSGVNTKWLAGKFYGLTINIVDHQDTEFTFN